MLVWIILPCFQEARIGRLVITFVGYDSVHHVVCQYAGIVCYSIPSDIEDKKDKRVVTDSECNWTS